MKTKEKKNTKNDKKQKKSPKKRETMVEKLKDYQHIKEVPKMYANHFENTMTDEWIENFIDCIAKGHDITTTCKIMGFSTVTFYKYIDKNDRLTNAYQKGMALRRYRLEQALHKRAEGYSTQEVVKNYDAEGNLTSTKTTDKEYVPDATSLIFALKNVYGDKYKDKVEQVVTQNVNVTAMLESNTKDLIGSLNIIDIPIDYEVINKEEK